MRISLALLFGSLLLRGASNTVPPVVPVDSHRGAKIFESEQCIRCHAVNGRGGKMGIDLGLAVSRGFTPSRLASTMWNHAPVMWGAIGAAKIKMPRLSPRDASDLFAFFYSARFFDRPGETARGQETFAAKQCGGCHGDRKSTRLNSSH